MFEDQTPEERLLRLIKEKARAKKEKAEEAPPQPAAPKQEEKGHPKGVSFHIPSIQLSALNKILLLAFVAIVAYLVYGVIDIQIKRTRLKPPAIRNTSKGEGIAGEMLLTGKKTDEPFSHYAEGIRKRELFKPVYTKAKQDEKPKDTTTISDLMKNITLIGIVQDESPQAIIEDRASGKTYFLTKGQSLGKLVIKSISPDRVRLGYGDEEADLLL